MKKSIVIIAIILILIIFLIGDSYGFPWEHIIATSRAKKYIEEKYQLTPIRVKYYVHKVPAPHVEIYTKELDFPFTVYTDRIRQISEMKDNYLEKLSEYYLTKNLKEYVSKVTNQNSYVDVSLNVNKIDKYSVNELKTNQLLVFEQLQEMYSCNITFFDNISKKNYDIDYDLVYDIYSKIFEIGLKPDRIFFSYGVSNLYLTIYSKDFPNINSLEDLKPFFEEAIQKKLNMK